MTRELKITSQNAPEGAPADDGFGPACVAQWIGDCRMALRNITCGVKSERAMLVARASMKHSVLGGGDFMAVYRQMRERTVPLSAEALAQIDQQVAASDVIREFIAVWVARDKKTGPCAEENAVCRRFSRLRYLVKLGILVAPTPEQEDGIREMIARKKAHKAKVSGADRRLA